MKIGVIYARYSSDKQTEQSIEGQVRVCKEYAKNNNIIIANTYIDRAMSGRYDNRDAFQQMIKDSKQKLWNCVIVYKFDRFSRNKYETELYKHKLKENDVTLISAMEKIPDGPEGILLESLIIGMNQYYSEELAQKTARGVREARIKGRYIGKIAPLGYLKNSERKLEIDKNEAEIVKIMFTEYANGLTTGGVANKLNEMGFKYRNNSFYDWNVRKVLAKKYYTGVVETSSGTYDNIYPKIIDEKLYEIVKEKLKKSATGKHVPNVSYKLRTKLFCGLCNNEYVSYCCSKQNSHLRYYRCRTNQSKRRCKSHTIKKELLEEIINKVLLKILHETNLDFLIDKIIKKHNRKFNEQKEILILEDDLKKINKSIKNIIDAIEQGLYSEKTKNRLAELEEQEAITNAKIANLKGKQNPVILKKETVLEFFNFALTQCPQTMIDLLIKKIVIFDDKLDVYLNYTTKTKDDDTKYKKITSYTEMINYTINRGRNRFVKKIFRREINIFV